MARYAKNGLVESKWVDKNKAKPDPRIVEVDEDTEAYDRGHIAGAVGLHWKNDLQDPLKREFISPEDFEKLMDRIGVTNDTQVILYGGNNNWFAAYAYWYFQYMGHRKVKLMNGGRKKCELEGNELTHDDPKVSATSGYKTKPPA